jgi:hypothetical protein
VKLVGWTAIPAALLLTAPGAASAAPADYPTAALTDYVFGCMASNGQTREALERCSCSIERIAEDLPYEDYEQAETVLRMQLVPSGDDRMVMFRTSAWAKEKVDALRRAQVAAEFACF